MDFDRFEFIFPDDSGITVKDLKEELISKGYVDLDNFLTNFYDFEVELFLND